MKLFNGMDEEQLRAFAHSRNIDIVSINIDDMREEVATKDADRFKNKGLRISEQKENPIEILTKEVLLLKERVSFLEKRLGDE